MNDSSAVNESPAVNEYLWQLLPVSPTLSRRVVWRRRPDDCGESRAVDSFKEGDPDDPDYPLIMALLEAETKT
jgi:hypothetical protein